MPFEAEPQNKYLLPAERWERGKIPTTLVPSGIAPRVRQIYGEQRNIFTISPVPALYSEIPEIQVNRPLPLYQSIPVRVRS